MENGSRLDWLGKKNSISCSLLLFFLSIPEISWAGEILLGQTSVSQLADVQSQDWEFQAWQALAAKYDCSNFNLSSSQPESLSLSRYEFAVGLHSCLNTFLGKLDQIEYMVSIDEFRLWQRLQADFAIELFELKKSIENLDITTQQIEENLFSTTTQLRGEVIFQLADSFGTSLDSNQDESQTLFGNRFRLNLITSFFGTDVLRTRLGSSDIGRLDRQTGTVMTRLGVEGQDDGQVAMEVTYRFQVGDRTSIGIGTSGAGIQQAGEVLNPLGSSGRGAISRFGRRDPITLRGSGSAGLTIQHELSDSLQVGAGYSTSDSNAASPGEGLFNDSYNAIAQILFEPTDNLEVAFTYTRKYQSQDNVNLMGSTGSFNANNPFDDNATIADGWGFQLNWYATKGLELGGWFGYAQAQQKQAGNQEATIMNGALTLAFPDLGGEGNLGGIIIGVPPIVTSHDDMALEDDRTAWHLEALYRIKVTDNIEITPGFFLVTNPNHEDNETIWVGTVRSLFSF